MGSLSLSVYVDILTCLYSHTSPISSNSCTLVLTFPCFIFDYRLRPWSACHIPTAFSYMKYLTKRPRHTSSSICEYISPSLSFVMYSRKGNFTHYAYVHIALHEIRDEKKKKICAFMYAWYVAKVCTWRMLVPACACFYVQKSLSCDRQQNKHFEYHMYLHMLLDGGIVVWIERLCTQKRTLYDNNTHMNTYIHMCRLLEQALWTKLCIIKKILTQAHTYTCTWSLEEQLWLLWKYSHKHIRTHVHDPCWNSYGYYENIHTNTYIHMYRITGGTVMDRIIAIDHFSEKDAAAVTADVLNAIHYLHSIGITHRDLKVHMLTCIR